MDTFKCICGNVFAVKGALANCKCGKGKESIDILNTPKKKETVSKEVKKSRKKLVSTLKEKETITDKNDD